MKEVCKGFKTITPKSDTIIQLCYAGSFKSQSKRHSYFLQNISEYRAKRLKPWNYFYQAVISDIQCHKKNENTDKFH